MELRKHRLQYYTATDIERSLSMSYIIRIFKQIGATNTVYNSYP